MKTWEEIVRDRQKRYLAILKGVNDVHLGVSACDELRMILESCVPVVRCRDCKHRGEICPMRYIETVGEDERIHDYSTDNGYCSWGERREDGEA